MATVNVVRPELPPIEAVELILSAEEAQALYNVAYAEVEGMSRVRQDNETVYDVIDALVKSNAVKEPA